MNRQDFLKEDYNGKFPISANTFAFMQEQIEMVAKIATMFGNNVILKKPTGSSDGLIVIRGELLPLRPISDANTVEYYNIKTNKETVTAQDSEYADARIIRYVEGERTAGSEYIRASSVRDLSAGNTSIKFDQWIIPVGGIIMWSGSVSNIPENYALCDGTNDTPNLKGRFIVGYDPDDTDYNAPRKTGGEKNHLLKETEMPRHNHEYRDAYFAENASVNNEYSIADRSKPNRFYGTNEDTDNDNVPIYLKDNPSTEYCGGGIAHENRPPYYVLAFIMRKK